MVGAEGAIAPENSQADGPSRIEALEREKESRTVIWGGIPIPPKDEILLAGKLLVSRGTISGQGTEGARHRFVNGATFCAFKSREGGPDD